jgi:PIN domain nuclease of toxin-antitoxin system
VIVKVLLDTCALVWAISEPQAMSRIARDVLSSRDTEACVSPISCAEVACAVERGRLVLDRHWKLWFRHFVEINDWQTVDIDLPIVEEAYSLPNPFHRDPADRILVATARVLSCPLMTADRKLLDYPHVDTIW